MVETDVEKRRKAVGEINKKLQAVVQRFTANERLLVVAGPTWICGTPGDVGYQFRTPDDHPILVTIPAIGSQGPLTEADIERVLSMQIDSAGCYF